MYNYMYLQNIIKIEEIVQLSRHKLTNILQSRRVKKSTPTRGDRHLSLTKDSVSKNYIKQADFL